MSADNNILRPVGLLEKMSTARQALGLYRSVVVTATYTSNVDHPNEDILAIFSAAIPTLLNRHPSLCCYLENIETHDPIFKSLQHIKISDVLQLKTLNSLETFEEHLQSIHDMEWHREIKPLWKIVILKEVSMNLKLNVAFVYHHAIGDGISGSAFHKTLSSSVREPIHDMPEIFAVPSHKLMDPIEKILSFPLSWKFLPKKLFEEYAPRWLIGTPNIWSGSFIRPPEKCSFRSRIRLVTISADDLKDLIKVCRHHDITLSSFLMTVITSLLANAVPDAQGLRGVTPYSLRPWTNTQKDDIVVQVSAFEMVYSSKDLNGLRETLDSDRFHHNFWDLARIFQAQMREELQRFPSDNVVGLLPYVNDYFQFFRKKLDQPRSASFELSNPGTVEMNRHISSLDWTVERMIFTQGAQPVGAAISFNCMTLQDGPLMIALGWQQSVIGEDIVDTIFQNLVDLPTRFKV